MDTFFHFVIVTHNSEESIRLCLESVWSQSVRNYEVTIVDSGSKQTDYLKRIEHEKVRIMFEKNIGFSCGNNLASRLHIEKIPYTIFMNPDVIIPMNFLASVNQYLELTQNVNVGIFGPKLLRYDLKNKKETRVIDSTGIFQKWYGKWYDRGQGEVDEKKYDSTGKFPEAICGALMICPSDVLVKTQLSPGEYFRNSFFMYKEDIELGLRMKSAGFSVLYAPELVAYHCRGWKSRKSMSFISKSYSAQNELFINRHRGFVKHLYSSLKLLVITLQKAIQKQGNT